MTIKDIAQLAGVSISTVSKIVNGKDETINSETRERVLRIVQEYNYTPYSSVKSISSAKSFLIGVLVNNMMSTYGLIKGIIDSSKENNYNVIVCDSYGDENEELKNITALCKNNVAGVIWDKVSEKSTQFEKEFKDKNIQIYSINDYHDEEAYVIDYEEMGYFVTQKMIDCKHTNIACVVNSNNDIEDLFFKGFQRCLYENKISFNEKMKINHDDESTFEEMIIQGVTGAVCSQFQWGLTLYESLAKRKYKIPNDFSIITLRDDLCENITYPKLSTVKIPSYEFGKYICSSLIHKLNKREHLKERFTVQYRLENENSIDLPYTSRNKKIVVIGSINMDIMINVDEVPQVGKAVIVKKHLMIPGGKGTNQAIGVAKMGNEVALIGKVGKDYEGRLLYDAMHENNINMLGISTDDRFDTGKAYIYVQRDGESSIALYSGANQNLTPLDIEKNKRLFENTGFCLLQTEIPIETVEYAAKVAKQYGAQIILKPSASSNISNELIQSVDYFVPNKKEISILCPHRQSIEEQADYFLEKGVKTVIITLGHKGCFVKNKDFSEYFPAADFVPIDTTGAADAFISALAVYLIEDYDLRLAIRYATYAAGFSVTRQGVVPALVDRNSLEMHFRKNEC